MEYHEDALSVLENQKAYVSRLFKTLTADSDEETHYEEHLFLIGKGAECIGELEQHIRQWQTNTPNIAITILGRNCDLVARLVEWRLNRLGSERPDIALTQTWYEPNHRSPYRRFPWSTVVIVVKRLRSATPIVRILASQQNSPAKEWKHLSFAADGRKPNRTSAHVHSVLGIDVEPLRVNSLVDFDFAEIAPPSPTTTSKSSWQQAGWTYSLLGELDRQLEQIGHSRTGPLIFQRHCSVSSLNTVNSTLGLLWIKMNHSAFPSEPEFLGRLPTRLKRYVPVVVLHGTNWFAMRDYSTSNPPKLSLADTVSTYQSEIRAALQSGSFDDISLRRPLSDIDNIFQELLDLHSWLPDELGQRLQRHSAEICSIVEAESELEETLVHGDLTASNIASVRQGFVIHDFTDIAFAPSCVDLVSLVRTLKSPVLKQQVCESLKLHCSYDPVKFQRSVVVAEAFQVANYHKLVQSVDQTAADHSSGTSLQGHLLQSAVQLLDALHGNFAM
ncbi:hypothetical protein KTJ89_06730 [Brevibacterium sediminis]|uniref:hypothetical protein n=1 Tax=Brevibacterium sediminis TaxID=1857024 RepID=UPI002174D19F|nr:hypothetical protein [Brevibacterium sediminis]MCS4592678.1 hypothetical protein [Brevibacterium sediminis]